jgi:transmembrane sensor
VLGVIQRAAAVLFIPVFLLSAYLFIQQGQGNVRTLAVRTNPGVVSAFDLPDGSKVWLNANSELRYPSDFNADTRTVELTGQGYFEVTKNAHKPFIVKADKDYSVEVLGTSFNVSAYKDESMIETTLVEGSVKLNVVSGGKRMTQMLKPNEKAEYQKGAGKIKVFGVNTEYDTAWKNGEIIFRNHPMDKVLKTLERHYHVVFEVKDNEILKSIITARFKDEQLPQVLEYLKLASGIQYAIHKPTVKDSGSGTSVVEISK